MTLNKCINTDGFRGAKNGLRADARCDFAYEQLPDVVE